MDVVQTKKKLYLIETGQKLDSYLYRKLNINEENMIVLHQYEVHIKPFGDLMRDIIISVYQENVDEIIVVGTKKQLNITNDLRLNTCANKELMEKIKTLDYLFKNCMPEFPEENIGEWLEERQTSPNDVIHSVNMIRHHPLMPANIKVRELWAEDEIEKRVEINTL